MKIYLLFCARIANNIQNQYSALKTREVFHIVPFVICWYCVDALCSSSLPWLMVRLLELQEPCKSLRGQGVGRLEWGRVEGSNRITIIVLLPGKF